jgi:hypothetical protein
MERHDQRAEQIAREMDLREQIRADTTAALPYSYYKGYGTTGYPYHGAPVGLGQLGFGEGKFAPELSRLQYQAPAERGLRTACEESEKLLERYRREKHHFTPQEYESNMRAPASSRHKNAYSACLEPVKSVATRVREEKELEQRLFHRSFNPYVDNAPPAPNYQQGYRVPELAIAADKAQREELSALTRARPAHTEGDRIDSVNSRAEEDALRQMHVLAPGRSTLSEAYRYRY